jgi:hypothetical protein
MKKEEARQAVLGEYAIRPAIAPQFKERLWPLVNASDRATADVVIRRCLEEGAKIARDLTARYAN